MIPDLFFFLLVTNEFFQSLARFNLCETLIFSFPNASEVIFLIGDEFNLLNDVKFAAAYRIPS